MASKSHAVNVLIKARDEASKTFGVVAVSARAMGRVFKSVANITKTAVHVAFQTVKRAAIGLAAALGYCSYAALKQEKAEVELASALKMLGEYSEEAMNKLKQQASEIQAATVYGDEYILVLMRMALTLGVTKEKAADAAKAAIALYEGFGGGRGKPEIFLRYYIDALRGTGASLDTYIGALRKARTQEEKLVILQDALARGWDVAKSKTESAGGALAQMKAKVGDIAEAIAGPLLPGIARSARAIKQWAATNEANVAHWAKRTFSYVTFIKDAFVTFIKFLKTDWKRGLETGFDIALETIKGFGRSIFAVLENVFKNIGYNITAWITNALREKKALRQLVENIWGDLDALSAVREGTKGMLRTPGGRLARTADIEKVRPLIEAEAQRIMSTYGAEALGTKLLPTRIVGGRELLEELKAIKRDTSNAIKKVMPAELATEIEKAFAKHEQRLKELGTAPGRQAVGVAREAGAPETFSLEDTLKGLLRQAAGRWQAREAGFLTFAPGTRFDYERTIARNSTEQLKTQRQFLTALNKLAEDFHQFLNRQPKPVEFSDLY
ncbi:MAG: hypothetical protein ACYTEQ_05580 [Planctomycetota bacterium]|jgi:hypothetical protein